MSTISPPNGVEIADSLDVPFEGARGMLATAQIMRGSSLPGSTAILKWGIVLCTIPQVTRVHITFA